MDSGKKNGEHQPRMQGDHERETESQQQRVSHPPEAGRRIKEPGENRKSTTKSRSPLAGKSRNPGENRKSTTKSQAPLKAGRRTKEITEKRTVNNKQSLKEPKSNPKEPPNQHSANPK